MIGRLVGRVVDEAADGTVVLDVGGVGYEVSVPLGSLGRTGTPPGEPITLHVHTHVREDALLLYGFATANDRAAFRSLIGVSNVGPKIAMNLLSVLPAHDLAAVVTQGHTQKLVSVPGVGKKTAERIVLELRDKLAASLPTPPTKTEQAAPRSPEGKAELLVGALTRMGFRAVEAERAVGLLGARVEADPLSDLVRDALALLSAR